ncbi:protein DpdE [Nocardia sp. NBC_01730]|nr:protein DpdE [Nocardia sp. NBC_01730]
MNRGITTGTIRGGLTVTHRFAVGQLVECVGSPGVGRVGEISDGHARVDFFESVAVPVALSEHVPLTKCRPAVLGEATRVFRRNPDTGDWLAGRVQASAGGKYYVQFPNYEFGFPIPEKELRVRWDRPVADPVTVLTAGGHESAYFHDARIPFLQDLVAQRAASANTPALLSSAVELFPHQIRAALTVLADPVQRYLLADEVGLGKTVEAGFVIRQTLIDKPDARICIVAPDVLRRQWIRELSLKFFIEDFPRAKISCVAHENPERWAKNHGSDLVVVDEAHRLVHASGPDESPYRELAGLAHSSTRLLLLSATPVMSHYLTQLGMLHLLAPDLYRWTDRDAFEDKYRLRSKLADCVFALDSEYTYLLPSAITRIRELLPPEDKRFAELSRLVLDLLADDDELLSSADALELKARTEALRAHISEAYRLHRRVIRHRRHTVLHDDPDAEFLPYAVRGRQDPEAIVIGSEAHDLTQLILSDWRSQVWDHLLDNGLEEYKPAYSMILGILVSRGTVLPHDLQDALEWRVTKDENAATRASLSERERVLLTEPDLFDFERTILDELRSRSAGPTTDSVEHLDDLINAMLPTLRGSHRVVLFCGPGSLAGSLADRLAQRFKKLAVYEHSRRLDMDASDEAVSAWSAIDQTGSRVLVVDDSAEDGLNLQTADAIVHVRLPWSPNQLEQRLGRVDRYQAVHRGPMTPALQYRVADHDPGASFLEAWAQLLTRGFRVFSDSVSTLQDAISEGLNEVWTAALEYGPEGLQAKAEQVHKELQTAQQEIDKMDMLEAIHETSTEGRDIAESVLAIEEHWRGMREAMLRYVADEGGIKLRHVDRTVDGCANVVFDPWQSRPLIDPRQWQAARAQLPGAAVQGAFNRSAALRAPGTRLFRTGNQLVDVLAQAIYLDDRGQASAFRRIDDRYHGDPTAYFGFDYLVEADLTSALDLVRGHADALTALRRQADRLLPPFTLKVWIQAGASSPISDERALGWLNRAYDNSRDHNYNMSTTSELLEIFGGWDRYRSAADLAARTARDHLSEVTDLAQKCGRAQEQSRLHAAVSMAQAQTRQAAGHLVGDAESLLTDTAVVNALIEDLSQPSVKVIAATCIIRAGREVRRDSK